jgi:hypothetical protein
MCIVKGLIVCAVRTPVLVVRVINSRWITWAGHYARHEN